MNKILKEVIMKDKKWEFVEIDNNRIEIRYLEYSNICKCWNRVGRDVYDKQTALEYQDYILNEYK